VRVLLAVLVLRPALIGVRMSGVVVAIRAVLLLLLITGAILVMLEHLALGGGDRGHGLDRDGQGQQQDRKKSAETSRHRLAL
jgi:hypothetical protein